VVFAFHPSAIGTCACHAYDRGVRVVGSIRVSIIVGYCSESRKKYVGFSLTPIVGNEMRLTISGNPSPLHLVVSD